MANGKFSNTGRSDDAWLVKSGDQILGPFPSFVIGEKILSREIVILDEVAPPEGRWRLIRDESVFASIVEEARRSLMNAREETEVGGIENTQITSPTNNGLVTPSRSSGHPKDNHESYGTIENGFRTGYTSRNTVDSYSDYDSTGSRQYGIRNRAKHGQRVMWMVALVAVIVATYLIYAMTRPQESRIGASVDFDRTLKAAKLAWEHGNFSMAEKLYGEAHHDWPDNAAIVAKLAPLVLQIDNQTVEAKRLLTDIQANIQTKKQPIEPALSQELDLSSALAALFSGDQRSAERLLKNINANDRLRTIASFNLGMAAFSEDHPLTALENFDRALSLPIAQYMKVRSLLMLSDRRGQRKEAAAGLVSLTKNEHDLLQEAQVLTASLLLDTENRKAAEARVRLALNADPEMTSQMWRDPLLFQSGMSWKPLIVNCRRLNTELKSSASRAMLAFCLNKAGLTEDASKTLGEAIDQSGEEPLLQAVNALFLAQNGRDDDASAALKLAFAHEPVPPLARLVKARVCTKTQDFPCAEEQWKALANDPQLKIPAQVGLAMMHQRQGNQKESQALISQVLSVAPFYKPALQMKAADGSGT